VDELISGHGEFVVQLEPAHLQEALTLVRAQPWGVSARVNEQGALVSAAPQGHGRDLNLFLVQAGFAPDTISPQVQDLEQVFLRLTGNGMGGIQ
jgi:ABC-2 type transport system ATP-binding protein